MGTMAAGRDGRGPLLRVLVMSGAVVGCAEPEVLDTILAAVVVVGVAGLAAATAADVFPLEPTVVHAGPMGVAGEC